MDWNTLGKMLTAELLGEVSFLSGPNDGNASIRGSVPVSIAPVQSISRLNKLRSHPNPTYQSLCAVGEV